MPEYLTPGVYIEEVSYRSKSIEGVSTTTTGFIGPTRYGPIDQVPDVVTSLGDFEAIYGDRNQLGYAGGAMHNYMWHAVRAFFEQGGQRLYIVRTFASRSGQYPPQNFDAAQPGDGGLYDDGHARCSIPAAPSNTTPLKLLLRARFPGVSGNMTVRFTMGMGQNILSGVPVPKATASAAQTYTVNVSSLNPGDVVYIKKHDKSAEGFYLAEQTQAADGTMTWKFTAEQASTPPPADPKAATPPPADPNASTPADPKANNTPATTTKSADLMLSGLTFAPKADASDVVRLVTLSVSVDPARSDALPLVWSGLPIDPTHTRNRVPDSWEPQFAPAPRSATIARSTPLVLSLAVPDKQPPPTALGVFALFCPADSDQRKALSTLASGGKSDDATRTVVCLLTGGNDGARPGADAYEGTADDATAIKTGLKAFEDVDDISIIAAPGATYAANSDAYRDDALTITNLLIAHAERMRYRIAILDSADGQSVADVRAMRGRIDSTYAALYYPWITILDPVTRQEINLPPSGFVAGIYARNDINRGVYKAPANEVVSLAIGFESLINKNQQAVLNPEGINCFRFFEGRGYRLWGARTASSDPEWKYVNLRRYFAYLEHSLDKGTQWAVFEPNGDALWANVRRTIEDFLFNEWKSGALLGDKPEMAYFVRCDRTTMTQNDLDNGRLICQVGVAPLRPAEFVIFRIGQWTGDSQA